MLIHQSTKNNNCQENELLGKDTQVLQRLKHAKYFTRFLGSLPSDLSSHDSTRAIIVFFSVCGLDVLNCLDLLKSEQVQNIIEWLYGSLVCGQVDYKRIICCSGFQGSRTLVIRTEDPLLMQNIKCYQWGHLAMTYASLSTLVVLNDDLSRINREDIIAGVAAVQKSDGSFSASIDGSEDDMRFVFCAAAICFILDFWGEVDKERMYQFIMNSMRYDYGFSQHTDAECHGGTTFCALAALQLSGQLSRLDATTIEGIKRWCLMRQMGGFQGRPNKIVDTCYSFWIGAALSILNAFELSNYEANRAYIMETEDNVMGGFSKWPHNSTDPFHTYMGICGLSFLNEPGLNGVMPSLNISMVAYEKLKRLHRKWRSNQQKNTNTNFDSQSIQNLCSDVAKLKGCHNEDCKDKNDISSPILMSHLSEI